MKKRAWGMLVCTAVVTVLLAGCRRGTKESGVSYTAVADQSSGVSENEELLVGEAVQIGSALPEASGDATSPGGISPEASGDATSPGGISDDGRVLNIRVWDGEFRDCVAQHYPGYKKTGKWTGKIGDVTVNWIHVTADDNSYRDTLDQALMEQEAAEKDDRLDMFLVGSEYASSYARDEYTADIIHDIGVSEEMLADQYPYTQDMMRDSEGALRGVAWQGYPTGMIYRRDIAKKVFGTDDPETIQAYFADWDAFRGSAAKLRDAGYLAVSSVYDIYQMFSDNASSGWVADGRINVDASRKEWVDLARELVDEGEASSREQWSAGWAKGFMKAGNVFAYFGSARFVETSMRSEKAGSVGKRGGWAMCAGPQGAIWGGTWISVADGTDNASLIRDMIEQLTGDADILTDIAKKEGDFVNNRNVMESLALDDALGYRSLGGQNPFPVLCETADAVRLKNMSIYDEICNFEFQTAMKEYFDGRTDYDSALDQFYKSVEKIHPDLSH